MLFTQSCWRKLSRRATARRHECHNMHKIGADAKRFNAGLTTYALDPSTKALAGHQRVDQRLDVAVAIGEGDAGRIAARNVRHVIRHQHV